MNAIPRWTQAMKCAHKLINGRAGGSEPHSPRTSFGPTTVSFDSAGVLVSTCCFCPCFDAKIPSMVQCALLSAPFSSHRRLVTIVWARLSLLLEVERKRRHLTRDVDRI